MPTPRKRPVARPVSLDVTELALRGRAPALMLANPNYFGTVKGSQLPVVSSLSGSTTFEQLTCVGLETSLDQVEAVVRIGANAGYSGPLCGGGSQEHVRFFVTYDGAASWTDLGVQSFTVHDTTGARPLDFAVNLSVPVQHRWCFLQNQPTLRAVLSWNHEPTPGDPDFLPIWGNVVDVVVQPTGSTLLLLHDLVEVIEAKVPPSITALLDLDQPLTLHPPQPATLVSLAAGYLQGDVQPHRFLFPALQRATSQATVLHPHPLLPSPFLKEIGVDTDLTSILDLIAQTDGDTSFEELGCVGYDPVEDALSAVLTVKRPNGYSGGPCTSGSHEFVAFWVDWGTGFEYAGTATAQVHDVTVPAGGLRYAVYLPLSTWAHRRACMDGPVQPTVRAILSWESTPPPSDPKWVPTWGNRVETHVALPPGSVTALNPVLDSLGGVPVCAIDQADGRTTAGDRPFGGVVTVTGFIPGAPDLSATPMRYQVQVRPAGGGWQTLTNDFGVTVTEQVGTALPVQYGLTQSVDPAGWYTYLEDPNTAGAGWRRVVGNVLAQWPTSEPMTGLWEVLVRAKDGVSTYAAQTLLCSDGTHRSSVTLRLDEVAPTATFALTSFTRGGVTNPAQDCMKFVVGDVLHGTYSVLDEHFDRIALELEPASQAFPARAVDPTWYALHAPQLFPSYTAGASTTGVAAGSWDLDTVGMHSCGYSLRFRTWDRTIVSGSAIGWEALPHAIGFSLE